ncbi:MAG: PEGA domain-containing protein [Planctomycetota bacterium]
MIAPLFALALVAVLPGCVTRKLFLVTDPPGARVSLDGRIVGTTPYSVEFLSYGTRRLELELDGHARRVEPLDLELPWWQVFPMDLVTDLLVPWTIEDERHFSFTLDPVDPEQGSWADARAARERLRALEIEEPFPEDGG